MADEKVLKSQEYYPLSQFFDLLYSNNQWYFKDTRTSQKVQELRLLEQAVKKGDVVKSDKDNFNVIGGEISFIPTKQTISKNMYLVTQPIQANARDIEFVAETDPANPDHSINRTLSVVETNQGLYEELLNVLSGYIMIEIKKQSRVLYKNDLKSFMKDKSMKFVIEGQDQLETKLSFTDDIVYLKLDDVVRNIGLDVVSVVAQENAIDPIAGALVFVNKTENFKPLTTDITFNFVFKLRGNLLRELGRTK